jgi:hypothetical protein
MFILLGEVLEITSVLWPEISLVTLDAFCGAMISNFRLLSPVRENENVEN